MKRFSFVSILPILLFIFLNLNSFGQNSSETKPLYLNNPNYQLEIEKYKIYKQKHADIVILGNSITHGINWNELLDRTSISEQGIPSDITEGILNRMDFVYKINPKICFIMVGVNDIFNWIPVETVFENYRSIVDKLKERNIIPVIQAVLYAGEIQPSAENRNQECMKLNKLLSDYAKVTNTEFLNLNRKMSHSNFLKNRFTYDGIHLNGAGFKVWGREVDKILRKYSL